MNHAACRRLGRLHASTISKRTAFTHSINAQRFAPWASLEHHHPLYEYNLRNWKHDTAWKLLPLAWRRSIKQHIAALEEAHIRAGYSSGNDRAKRARFWSQYAKLRFQHRDYGINRTSKYDRGSSSNHWLGWKRRSLQELFSPVERTNGNQHQSDQSSQSAQPPTFAALALAMGYVASDTDGDSKAHTPGENGERHGSRQTRATGMVVSEQADQSLDPIDTAASSVTSSDANLSNPERPNPSGPGSDSGSGPSMLAGAPQARPQMHKQLRSRATRFVNRLWTFIKDDIWILVGAAALQAASTLLGITAPNLLSSLAAQFAQGGGGSGGTAGGSGQEKGGTASRSVLVIGLVLAGQFVLRLGATFLASWGSERVCGRMRAALFDSLMRHDMAYHDASKAGDLLQMLDADVREVRRSVREVVGNGVGTAAALIGGLASLVMLSPTLTASMVAVSLPAVVAGNSFFYFLRQKSREYSDASARASSVAAESLANVRLVQSYTGEEAALSKFSARHDEAGGMAVMLGAYAGVFHACLSLGMSGAVGGLLLAGGKMVASGQLSQGDLAAFVAQSVGLQRSLMGGSALAARLSRAGGTVSRVLDQMDVQPVANHPGGLRWNAAATGGNDDALGAANTGSGGMDVAQRDAWWSGAQGSNPPDGSDKWRIAGDLQLKGVRFQYPSRPGQTVLDGLDLSVGKSTVTAIVGTSGAGKSTITSLIQRFYTPVEGEVLIDGRNILDVDAAWIRSQIAVVPQEPVLWSGTVRENIRYGRPSATDAEVEAAARDACCDFAFQLPSGLDTKLGERGSLISGGQRQRLAIARAILRKPRILLLDEPAAAQDAHNAAMVRAALRRAMKDTTTIIIAHRLSSVRHADKIVVLEAGRAVEEGTHEELLAKGGRYTSMVQKQLS